MTDDDPTPPRDPADSDPLAGPRPDHPVHALLWLLERARERGFRIGPHVEISGIRVQVADLRQAKIEGVAMPDAPSGDGGGIWAAHGYEGGE